MSLIARQKYNLLFLHRQWGRHLVSKNSQEGRITTKQSLPKVFKYVLHVLNECQYESI